MYALVFLLSFLFFSRFVALVSVWLSSLLPLSPLWVYVVCVFFLSLCHFCSLLFTSLFCSAGLTDFFWISCLWRLLLVIFFILYPHFHSLKLFVLPPTCYSLSCLHFESSFWTKTFPRLLFNLTCYTHWTTIQLWEPDIWVDVWKLWNLPRKIPW